jgi:hypothetical protein
MTRSDDPPYVRGLADHGPGRVERYPPGTYPVVVASCSQPGCPSAVAMPAGTSIERQNQALTLYGWAAGPAGPVCPCDHLPPKSMSLTTKTILLVVVWTAALAIGPVLNLARYSSVWTMLCTAVIVSCASCLLFCRHR